MGKIIKFAIIIFDDGQSISRKEAINLEIDTNSVTFTDKGSNKRQTIPLYRIIRIEEVIDQ